MDDYQLFWISRKAMCIGTCLAILISWESNHSIWWAIGHGILSWIYVIYHVATS
jgi:hypothetical protein